MDWFSIENIENVDSPSMVLYEEHLMHNLKTMLSMVNGNTDRLMPHVKTYKMPEVIKRMVNLGIYKFKVSTIAEGEMAASAGANQLLIAHQLVGPKTTRFIELIKRFPKVMFYALVDNIASVQILADLATKHGLKIGVFIDVNSGMNRSGLVVGEDFISLTDYIISSPSAELIGLHVYDGHYRNPNFNIRRLKIETGFKEITETYNALKKQNSTLQLVSGGSPAFSSHLLTKDRICSPGTCVLWDWGYGEMLSEQKFKYAALLITRVISKPIRGIITIDLGHKSVAAENPINKRVKFLNLENYTLQSQSEEHGVLEVKDWDTIEVGDVFYGVPYHICPTVNLYDEISVIKDGKFVDKWEITARKRKITI